MSASQSILIDHWGLPKESKTFVSVQDSQAFAISFKIPLFKKFNCQVYWTPQGRLINYNDGCQVLIKRSDKKYKYLISANSFERWLEIGKLCYLSTYGFYIEQQGKMRLHSAVLKKADQVSCYWGLPNSGKTTLAKKFLDSKKRTVLTDELCFFDGKNIEAVPLKLHDKDQKQLLSIDESRLERFPLKSFFLLSKSHNQNLHFSRIDLITRIKTFFLLILGLGIHQMAEYHLTMMNVPAWTKILFLRIRLAWVLANKYPWYQISLSYKKL